MHFVGQSPQIREMLHLIARVAETDSTVVIRGESGVGKELVARAVHRTSRRATQPFVVVDCASLHENLLQSELFGHEKGAYTGAVRLKHGPFEVADRGTIFLDEIGEITPSLQVKLLRVLETGTFRRLGGTADIQVDVRVLAATNRKLESMMKEGQFREDLYYRLNVFAITIPPLRDRRDDIPLLVEHFIRNSSIVPKRQRARAARGDAGAAALRLARERARAEERDRARAHPVRRRGRRARAPAARACASSPRRPTRTRAGWRRSRSSSAGYIQRVLGECKGHRQKAAKILGISERNLYRKIKEYGDEVPD